ncbi:MAG: Calx-beta domain-containing protein [Acidimicrobiales bacterium]
MVSLLAALPSAANAEIIQVFADDFESDTGWQANPAGTDTATTGNWERANPEETSFSGTKQRGDTTSGSNGLVTGASAGSSVGVNDIDSGVTSIQSPVISLANVSTAELSFDYYLSHLDNSSSDDFFRVSIVGDTTQTVLSEEGAGNDDDASWQRAVIDISSFAGQSIRILVEAADASSPSLVEAGVDTLLITGDEVEVNQPPSVTSPGAQQSTEGDVVSLQVVGTDADEDTLTWSATGLPADLSIDSATGIISGTVAAESASETPYDVSVTASDGTDSTTVDFPWTVDAPVQNQAPVVTTPADQVSTEGDVVSLQVVGTDADEDPISWSATGLPADLSIDSSTGLISGTLGAESASETPYAVSVTADDGTDSTTVNFAWTVGIPVENQSPIPVNPGDQVSVEGDVISLQLEATDPDGDPVQFFSEVLPTGLTLDNDTGIISGTLAEGSADGSPWGMFVAVSDGISPAVLVSFTWTVTAPGENQAPVVTSPGDQQSEEGDVVSLAVVGTDADEDPLTWSATGLPADLVIDAATGVISGTVADGAEAASPYSVAVSAADGTDTTTVNFVWNVGDTANQPPFILNAGPQASIDGDVIEGLQIIGSDPEGQPLVWSATGLPVALVIDATTGMISGTLADDASANSPYLVAVSASDGALSSTMFFEWIVTDGTTQNTIITGTITDANGDPFIPAEVDQYTVGPNGERGEFILSRANVPAGTYTIFTEPGCYFMTFIAPDGQTYNGVGFFTPPSFCVEEGDTQVVDAQLDAIGGPDTIIGGTVLSETGGAEGVQVDLFEANADGSRGAYLDSTNTGSDGTYSFDVAAGCFVMTFVAPEGETFNGLGFFNNGGCVEAGETVTDVDATLDGAVINDTAIGGVVSLGDGSPAAGVGIDLFTQAADGSRDTYLASRVTDAEGIYSFGVDPGAYVLTFIALPGETFNGDGFLSLPQTVVAEQIVTDLNAAMDGAAASSIGGTVTDGAGDPAPGVGVDLFEANPDGSRGTYLRSDTTDAAGVYSIGADAGCYILTFIAVGDNTFNGNGFLSLPQCVEAGETVSDLDAQYDGAVGGTVTVSIGNGATAEGSEGQVRQVTLLVTLSEASATEESITVSTADDTATAGSDYVALTTTITFAPGETEKSVSFDVLGDDVFEQVDGADERFDVLLSEPSAGLVIGDGAGFARIIEDDEEVGVDPVLSIADASVAETDAEGVVTLTVTMSATADADVTVDVATADGTAIDLEDYVGGAGPLTITAGETEVSFDVVIVGDDIEEATEEFSVSLSNPVGATLGDDTATVIITDDDETVVVLPTLSIADASIAETDEDGVVEVTVTLSAASDTDVSFDVATADGTAVDLEDYVGGSGTVTIPAGVLSGTAPVPIIGDDIEEPTEEFTITLSNPVGATIADGTATVTIEDDDEALGDEITISVSDVTVTELNDGLRNALVVFTLSRPAEQTVVVQFTTVDGTATLADNDYLTRAEELRFAPGNVTLTRAIKTVGDGNIEDDETLTVELFDPSDNAVIGDGVGVVTILNND